MPLHNIFPRVFLTLFYDFWLFNYMTLVFSLQNSLIKKLKNYNKNSKLKNLFISTYYNFIREQEHVRFILKKIK